MLFMRKTRIAGLALIALLGGMATVGPAAEGQGVSGEPAYRITVQEVLQHQESGEEIVFLDSRNRMAYASANQKIPGAIRVSDQGDLDRLVTELPRNRLIVAYCT